MDGGLERGMEEEGVCRCEGRTLEIARKDKKKGLKSNRGRQKVLVREQREQIENKDTKMWALRGRRFKLCTFKYLVE